MEQRVEVSHSEGLARHAGPESCAMSREAQGEALTGEGVGWVLSRERWSVRGADAVVLAEGKMDELARRELVRPCVVEDPSMHRSSMSGNREISGSTVVRSAWRPASGRSEDRSR
jgi:RNA-directed DNA polymerase